ncbi:hypothetical protein Trydic_g15515 [Trypoxylus dichotomus]
MTAGDGTCGSVVETMVPVVVKFKCLMYGWHFCPRLFDNGSPKPFIRKGPPIGYDTQLVVHYFPIHKSWRCYEHLIGNYVKDINPLEHITISLQITFQ